MRQHLELIFASIFLVLFTALALDVVHQLNSTDIHGAVESIVLAQGGTK